MQHTQARFRWLLPLWLCLAGSVESLKHNFAVYQDGRTLIAPIGTPYGFLSGGCFGLEVFDYNLEVGHKHKKKDKKSKEQEEKQKAILKDVQAGFLLKRFASSSAFTRYEETYLTNSSHCVFEYFQGDDDDDSALPKEYSDNADITTAGSEGIFMRLHYSDANETWALAGGAVKNYTFKEDEAGLYFLMYQVCPSTKEAATAEIRSSFEIDFHYLNRDKLGLDSFLTAGDMPLPTIYLYFFFSYLFCAVIWILNIRGIQRGREGCFAAAGERPKIYPIHHLMSALIVLKTLTVLFESVRYHYIRLTGHAEFWTVVYYGLSFLKGTFLFTVILLIGSGWSYLKPCLTDREKKVIFVVLFLQVVDNIAMVVLSQETEGESDYAGWSVLLHVVDIVCCVVILVPIAWQVTTLEKTTQTEGMNQENHASRSEEAKRTLIKLKKFRAFYFLVVCYIYFTRIVIYLFSTVLDYRHTWVRYLVVELATLAFYGVTGLHMRPVPDNPYLSLSKDDEVDEIELG